MIKEIWRVSFVIHCEKLKRNFNFVKKMECEVEINVDYDLYITAYDIINYTYLDAAIWN